MRIVVFTIGLSLFAWNAAAFEFNPAPQDFRVPLNSKSGDVDESGHVVENPRFETESTNSEKLSPVKVGTLWGYVNRRGELAVNPAFDAADSFSEGLAAVRISDQ